MIFSQCARYTVPLPAERVLLTAAAAAPPVTTTEKKRATKRAVRLNIKLQSAHYATTARAWGTRSCVCFALPYNYNK